MHPPLDYSIHDPMFRRLIGLAAVLILLAGCAGTPKSIQTRRTLVNPIVRYALSLQGTPYRWGKESPYQGFDCSGFVKHVYARHGVRLPRTAYQMATALPSVGHRGRRPGDLVFFNTTGQPYSHVGIYIGNNAFVHSSSAKGRVIVSNLTWPYWWTHFLGVRRPDVADRFLSGRTEE